MKSQITNNGLVFELRSDGTASVISCTGRAASVIIPESVEGHRVTDIGPEAFMNCHNLFLVKIPACVRKIGRDAFKNCGRVKRVDEDLARGYTAHCRRDLEYMFGYGYEAIESRMIGGEDPVKITYELTADVERGSYAETYCSMNKIRCNPR